MELSFLADWSNDDILNIDPQTLFRPNGPNLFDDSSSTLQSFHSFIEADFPDQQQSPSDQVADSGYISSNSSDSGKHSPSGSDTTAGQGSPWVFPPFQRYETEHGLHQAMSSTSETSDDSPTASPSANLVFQTVSPPPCPRRHPSTSAKKYVYLVPKEPRSAAVPVSQLSSPPATAALYAVSSSPVYVKPEPPSTPIYVKQEMAPIYINASTGTQLQPIQPRRVFMTRDSNEDELSRKIEDRKAKNRAAAQASRVKKQAEVDELRSAVEALKVENEGLRSENMTLKQRLGRYERVQEVGSPSRKRMAVAGTITMAVFMVMTVNSISLESTPVTTIPPTNQLRSQPTGRVLSPENVEPLPLNSTLANCVSKKFYNSTEAIRLNSDLYEWVDRHEAMGLGVKGKHRLLQKKKQKDWLSAVGTVRVNVTNPTEQNRTAGSAEKKPKDRLWRHLDMISTTAGARDRRAKNLLKVEKKDQYYTKLTTAIQQKQDTLYVVALEDYFLLPAVQRNFTATPKVTLILPALSYNSTLSGKVPLMRIDLRVVGTGLFQLSRHLLPPFLQ